MLNGLWCISISIKQRIINDFLLYFVAEGNIEFD